MLETTEAIVLSARKYSETSKIVTFFTKDFGKINAMVKGARNSKSKFGSTLEPMNYLSITYYKKPASQLQLLSDAEIVINFWNIRTSLEHTAFGFSVVETVYKILEEHYVNTSIFEDIVATLEKLNKISNQPFSIFLKFLFNFVINLGIDINIANELLLQEHPGKRVAFNYENGSFFAYNTKTEDNRYYLQIEESLYRKINEIYNSSSDSQLEIEFSKNEVYKIINLFNKFLNFHTEKSLFLESLNLIY
jgi:DNA repair protein RecO (recombination protein O)